MKPIQPKAVKALCLPALAALVALTAQAALAQDKGWYVGAGVGRDWSDVDVNAVVTGLHSAGYNSSVISTYDDDVSEKVLAGYKFNRNFALEGSYFDLGKFTYTANAVPTAVQQGKAAISGIGLDLIGMLPLQDSLSVFARVGINSANIKQSFSNNSLGAAFTNHSSRGTHADYGVGLQWDLSDAFSVRAELERYRIDSNSVSKDSVDALSLSVLYRFGTSKPAPEVAKPVVAPVPAPAPVPVAPAPLPVPVKITLAASALFDFDKSELKPAGKQELDKLLRDIKGVRYEVIIVTGHTDRIGKHSYNLALSERRANAVRTYLVNGGIPAGNITAKGVSSDEPVTTKQQCTGPVSAKLKACLQPDRRVEVEVSGTRDSR